MEKTISAYHAIAPRRYRETNGLYYEDFAVGDVFEHRPGRTITDVDNIWMTLLTMNVQPVHFDAAYAAKNRVEEDARGQHVHTCAAHRHERADRQRKGRCQSGVGQGEGYASRLRRGHALCGIDRALQARIEKPAHPGNRNRVNSRHQSGRQRGNEFRTDDADLQARSLAGNRCQLLGLMELLTLVACPLKGKDDGLQIGLPIETHYDRGRR